MVAHELTRCGRKWTALVGSVAVLLAVGACRGGDGDGIGKPTTTTAASQPATAAPSTSTTEAMSGEEAKVRLAYEAASQAFIEAAAIPDPNYATLTQTHVGPMLEQRRQTLLGLKADGRVIRYPQPSAYRIKIDDVQIDGEVARLVACVVDDGERVEVATGRVIASGVGTVEWSAALRRVDGTWRLAERVEKARWEGVSGCAVR